MFVRRKRISGKDYYYLVKSVREGEQVKQKFVEYVGTEKPGKERTERMIKERTAEER